MPLKGHKKALEGSRFKVIESVQKMQALRMIRPTLLYLVSLDRVYALPIFDYAKDSQRFSCSRRSVYGPVHNCVGWLGSRVSSP